MKRTTVYADEDDLAILKAAAARRGIPEAELMREAIHVEAMANRTWDEPFFTRSYVPGQEASHPRTDDALEAAWEGEAAAYERTKDASG